MSVQGGVDIVHEAMNDGEDMSGLTPKQELFKSVDRTAAVMPAKFVKGVGKLARLKSIPLEVVTNNEGWIFTYGNLNTPLIVEGPMATTAEKVDTLWKGWGKVLQKKTDSYLKSHFEALKKRIRNMGELGIGDSTFKIVGTISIVKPKANDPKFHIKFGNVVMSTGNTAEHAAELLQGLDDNTILLKYQELKRAHDKKREVTDSEKKKMKNSIAKIGKEEEVEEVKPKTADKKAVDHLAVKIPPKDLKFIAPPLPEPIVRPKTDKPVKANKKKGKETVPKTESKPDNSKPLEKAATKPEKKVAPVKAVKAAPEVTGKETNPNRAVVKEPTKADQRKVIKDKEAEKILKDRSVLDERKRLSGLYKSGEMPTADTIDRNIKKIKYELHKTTEGEKVSESLLKLAQTKNYDYINSGESPMPNDCLIVLGRTACKMDGSYKFVKKLYNESTVIFDVFMYGNSQYKAFVNVATDSIIDSIGKVDLPKLGSVKDGVVPSTVNGKTYIDRGNVILDFTRYVKTNDFSPKVKPKKTSIIKPEIKNRVFHSMKTIAKMPEGSRFSFVKNAGGWYLKLGSLKTLVLDAKTAVKFGLTYNDVTADTLIVLYDEDTRFADHLNKILTHKFDEKNDISVVRGINSRVAKMLKGNKDLDIIQKAISKLPVNAVRLHVTSNEGKEKPPKGMTSISKTDVHTEILPKGETYAESWIRYVALVAPKINGWVDNFINSGVQPKKMKPSSNIIIRSKVRQLFTEGLTLMQIREQLKLQEGELGVLPGSPTYTTIDMPVFNAYQQKEMISRGIDPCRHLNAALSHDSMMRAKLLKASRVKTIRGLADLYSVHWSVRVLKNDGKNFLVAMFIKSRNWLSPSPDGKSTGRWVQANSEKSAAFGFIYGFYPYDVKGFLTQEANRILEIFASIQSDAQNRQMTRTEKSKNKKDNAIKDARDAKEEEYLKEYEDHQFNSEETYDENEDYVDDDYRDHDSHEDSGKKKKGKNKKPKTEMINDRETFIPSNGRSRVVYS